LFDVVPRNWIENFQGLLRLWHGLLDLLRHFRSSGIDAGRWHDREDISGCQYQSLPIWRM
jgi:hypothetical protein